MEKVLQREGWTRYWPALRKDGYLTLDLVTNMDDLLACQMQRAHARKLLNLASMGKKDPGDTRNTEAVADKRNTEAVADEGENVDKNWHYASGEWASFLKEKKKRGKSKFGERKFVSFFRKSYSHSALRRWGKCLECAETRGIDIAKLDDEFVRVTQNALDTYHPNHPTAAVPVA